MTYWAEDLYWRDALDEYYVLRDQGVTHITLDLAAIEQVISSDGSVAYKLLEAMTSVLEHEEMDGFRGAPRLVLAALQLLAKEQTEPDRSPHL